MFAEAHSKKFSSLPQIAKTFVDTPYNRGVVTVTT